MSTDLATNLYSLTALNLASNKIDVVGISALAQNNSFGSLTNINLDDNNISYVGIKSLAILEVAPIIRTGD